MIKLILGAFKMVFIFALSSFLGPSAESQISHPNKLFVVMSQCLYDKLMHHAIFSNYYTHLIVHLI